ncbi:hypothetical protein BKA65DRAFT_434268 [Rhexocercosporidium sp. MPI-PUGE-AT-0058]|nr:hypothetical protein BKA65DRAFT_434268 [Rhexocercosporidium sp. MPI-PUGE-AT-0058]
MAVPVNCLVIGIDYGTTYTGVAYRDLTFDEHGNVRDSEIQIVRGWPGIGAIKDENKVPSQISYDVGFHSERQWGYDISTDTARLGLTKLQLEDQDKVDELKKILEAVKAMETLDFSRIEYHNGLALTYSKDPEAVVADYLSKIREHLMGDLRELYDAVYLALTPIDLVVTVPAEWSEGAKDRTLRAFRQAGFDKGNPDFASLRETILMSEPEAAALAVVRDFDGENVFRAGDCFVVCDAGGGTVDLISYRIRDTRPLVLEEVGYATGGKFGASYIDTAFQTWLHGKIGSENYAKLITDSAESAIGSHKTITKDMQELMTVFEPVKRHFDGTRRDSSIALPRILEDIPEDRTNGILDGEIRITHKDLALFFDPIVGQILDLIERQITQVKMARHNVKDIILSGGFGESPYLQKKIKEFARHRRIETRIANDPWLSVVRGAVQKGLEQNIRPQSHRRSRSHYGVSTSQPFTSFRHNEKDAYNDPFDGEKKARRQMTWLIRKGDTLPSGSKKVSMEICRKFGPDEERVFSTTIIRYNDDFAPQSQDDIHGGGAKSDLVYYDLSNFTGNFTQVRGGARGTPYFSAKMELQLELFENNTYQVTVSFNKQVIAASEVFG